MTVWRAGSKTSLSDDGKEPETCVCKTDCIERPIRRYFYKHGGYVAKHPYPFFLIPLIMSACLGFGLKYFQLETDTEYLVTPKNGEAKMERKVITNNFHLDQAEHFLPERGAVLDGFLDVIIASRDGGHVLSSRHVRSIHKLDAYIRGLTARDDVMYNYTYEAICARWHGRCTMQPILAIYSNVSTADYLPLTYPWFNNQFFLGNLLGTNQLLFLHNCYTEIQVLCGPFFVIDLPADARRVDWIIQSRILNKRSEDLKHIRALITPCLGSYDMTRLPIQTPPTTFSRSLEGLVLLITITSV